MLRKVVLLSVLITPPVAAQAASYTFFGAGCTAAPAPTFTVQGLPRLGASIGISTSSTWFYLNEGAWVAILTGASNQSAGGVPLPFDPTVLNGPGVTFCGFLLQSSEIAIPVPRLAGPARTVTTTLAIPNNAALLGVTVYQQVWEARISTIPPRALHVLSRGGQMVIGR